MLLVVGAETAIVGTSIFHRGVEMLRHFRRLNKHLTATAIVVDVFFVEGDLVALALECTKDSAVGRGMAVAPRRRQRKTE